MSLNPSTPWHKASYDRFLQGDLPQLLAGRIPLVAYRVESTGPYTCRVVVALGSSSGDVEVAYTDLPQPDDDGLFEINGELRVVLPTASTEKLDVAEIRCAGQQLYDYVEERLGQAPTNGLPWDDELVRAWLPLEIWIDEFMLESSQLLEIQILGSANWLTRQTHLRRLLVPDREKVVAAGQAGRVCPFEMPEGSNLGRVFTIAVGAEIRDGRLIVVDERPEASLGLSASMIPFLEHNESMHVLMGANMLRQWLAPVNPEPALVQTGNEPDAPDFWVGRNLLTAFISWGADTFAEGIVISKSCARRLDYPYQVEPGDKLSNRHGTKGVVSRILPDDEMPHLPDGTPIELVFSFIGIQSRMNIGQLREAVMGRIARSEGTPATVPPFHAPTVEELRERLAGAGLGSSGMELLTLGEGGPRLQRPSTIGWVYWGRTFHLAQSKVKSSVKQGMQRHGEMESYAMRSAGAYENLQEVLNTRAGAREDAHTLAQRLTAGPVKPAAPPAPLFSDLASRLRVAGIEAVLEEGKLGFHLSAPPGEILRLAHAVSHPWLRERQLSEIGACPVTDGADAHANTALFPPWSSAREAAWPLDEYALVVQTNDRLAQILESQVPERLTRDAISQLKSRVKALFGALLTPAHLRLGTSQLFSGRTVIAPGVNLRLDQVGLADEIAWDLFGPLVIRELGDDVAVQARDERAAQVLEEVMARSWVIINRAPTLSPAALIAFRPVRDPGNVIRLHPLACEWLNADFDGDQVAVFLPITEAAQREAGERLSVAGHLARDPALLEGLLPPSDALWGLASLSLTERGRREIAQLAGIEAAAPDGLVSHSSLVEAMKRVLARDGLDAVISALEQLAQRGFDVAKASGASLSPFVGARLEHPPAPKEEDPELWEAYSEELMELLATSTDYRDAELGPQLLTVRSSARELRRLASLVGPQGAIEDIQGVVVIVRHGYSEGLTPEEMYASAARMRERLTQILAGWEDTCNDLRARHRPQGFHVLARARRSKRPGIVFARAAAAGEVDPLVEVDSRLLVGLPVSPDNS